MPNTGNSALVEVFELEYKCKTYKIREGKSLVNFLCTRLTTFMYFFVFFAPKFTFFILTYVSDNSN